MSVHLEIFPAGSENVSPAFALSVCQNAINIRLGSAPPIPL